MTPRIVPLEELVARIPEGARIAVGGHHFARVPVAALLQLAKVGPGGLRWFSWGGGLPLEILLEAGRIARIDLCFSSLDIFGLPPRFRAVAEARGLPVHDWPALAMIAALEAGMRNLPYLPVQLPEGSDMADRCPGLCVAQDEGSGRSYGRVAAVRPDVALIHAPYADAAGNVAILGARALDVLLAGAARDVLVTVDEIVPEGALAGMGRLTVIPRPLIGAIAHVPGGAAPTSCLPQYVTGWQAIRTALDAPSLVAALADRRIAPDLRAAARLAPKAIRAGAFAAKPADDPPTVDEIMAIRLSRMLDDATFASAGAVSPLANVAYRLARATHAPGMMLMTFTAGHLDVPPGPLSLSLYEVLDAATAAAHAGGEDTYAAYYQAGRVTHEIIGAAQVDRRGRVNNLELTKPSGAPLRLAGQGGMSDVANMHAQNVLYVTRHSPRTLVEQVAVASSARGVTGARRAELGYRPGGTTVLTDLCLLRLDEEEGTLVVTETLPGVGHDAIRAATGWEVRFAPDCREMDLPDAATLAVLRSQIDPLGLRRLEFVAARDRASLLDEILARDRAGLVACLDDTQAQAADA
ncbi:MAG: hypothetical protein JJT81_01015 [Rubellimicrobium sp.]|nr:hypothetical protein [Rubellimicrobium sp.]